MGKLRTQEKRRPEIHSQLSYEGVRRVIEDEISLRLEIENALRDFLIKREMISNARERARASEIIFNNVVLSRNVRIGLEGQLDFEELGFDLVTSPHECIGAYELVHQMYEEVGFNNLTRIGGEKKERTIIPGLNYDDNDSRSVTAIVSREGEIVGTSRIILDSPGIFLPAEKLYNPENGFNTLRTKYLGEGLRIGEISKLANSRPGAQWKALMRFWHVLSESLRIGNLISISSEEDFSKINSKFGFNEQRRERFYEELESPDVIATWDQREEISPFYRRIILGERPSTIH